MLRSASLAKTTGYLHEVMILSTKRSLIYLLYILFIIYLLALIIAATLTL